MVEVAVQCFVVEIAGLVGEGARAVHVENVETSDKGLDGFLQHVGIEMRAARADRNPVGRNVSSSGNGGCGFGGVFFAHGACTTPLCSLVNSDKAD